MLQEILEHQKGKSHCSMCRGKEQQGNAHKAHKISVCVCDFKFYFLKLPYSKIYSLAGGVGGEERAYIPMKGNTDVHIPVATIKRIQKSSTIAKADSTNNSPKLALANNRHNE